MKKHWLTIAGIACVAATTAFYGQAQERSIADDDRAAEARVAEEREEKAKRENRNARAMLGELREIGARITGVTVAGSPFSAEAVFETVQRLEDGNSIRRERKTRLFRDMDGRTREEILTNDGEHDPLEPRLVLIGDPQADRTYLMNPRKKVYEQIAGPRSAEEYADRREEDERAEGERSEGPPWVEIGKRTIEGVEAVGTRRTQVIAPGRIGNEREIRIVSEKWYSPELRMDVLTTRSDPRRGVTTFRLANVRLTEPLPTLFQVPANYAGATDDDRD